MTDQDYMRRALVLALKGRGRTSPNPMVGALIVKGDRVLAEGWHKKCGTDHAEIVALKKAGRAARGARLYVNLEPCCHYGRTPPCVRRIIESGIKEVIIGIKDPNPCTNGKGIAKLRRAGIKVKTGVLHDQARQVNEAFFKYIKSGMPFVAAKCAQSLDGKIATAAGHSKWITGKRTRGYARALRDDFDAILVGINTVLKDNPGLNGSRRSKKIKKVILDSSLKISSGVGAYGSDIRSVRPESRSMKLARLDRTPLLFRDTDPSDCVIAVTQKASKEKIKLLRDKGISVVICPQKNGSVDLKWLFKQLVKLEIMSILIEGGARALGDALKHKLVDKMYVYVAPKIIGDQDALSSITGVNTMDVSKAIQLKDMALNQIGKDILITGYV